MIRINLEAVANQSFNIDLEDSRYKVVLKEANGCMVCDIERDGEILLNGSRCVAGVPLIPYRAYEEGNFIFVTENDMMPYYTEFEITQTLYYLTEEEVQSLRNQ